MRIVRPSPNETFRITSEPAWPDVVFESDEVGAHAWRWTIAWGTFTRSGVATTPDHRWNARSAITNLGGTLTVRAEAQSRFGAAGPRSSSPASSVVGAVSSSAGTLESLPVSVKIVGTNPSEAEVGHFLVTRPNSAGFDKLLRHESRFKQFRAATSEPVKSHDNGYGMCQLTKPVPTFEQVWSWKRNIDGGLALFEQKRAEAIAYLGQSQRHYTADQLTREAVWRWNGGAYHTWDATGAKWIRTPTVLCDGKTGNMGWDMTDARNAGKTEAELHTRDQGSYGAPRVAGAPWRYLGICYADSILG